MASSIEFSYRFNFHNQNATSYYMFTNLSYSYFSVLISKCKLKS